MRQKQALSRKVSIVGVGITRQGGHGDADGTVLALQAFRSALEDAGIRDKHRIDGLLGAKQFDGSGIDPVLFSRTAGITPSVTGALDYSTAAFTLHYGAALVASGACDMLAFVYGRNPAGSMVELSGAQEYDLVHGFYNAAAVHGLSWVEHMHRYGTTTDVLGRVAVQARRHAQLNPDAAFREPLTMDDYRNSAPLIWPLRELDVCRMSGGGAAIIMAASDIARDCAKLPVDFLSVGREAHHALERGIEMSFSPGRRAAKQLFEAAGIGPQDVDVLFPYEATTVAAVAALENYGFCQPGECEDFIGDGSRIGLGGDLPMNTHGGHLSGGYLIGLTHHVELVRQLRGECGERQVKGAQVALYASGGGIRAQFYHAATLFARGDWNA